MIEDQILEISEIKETKNSQVKSRVEGAEICEPRRDCAREEVRRPVSKRPKDVTIGWLDRLHINKNGRILWTYKLKDFTPPWPKYLISEGIEPVREFEDLWE